MPPITMYFQRTIALCINNTSMIYPMWIVPGFVMGMESTRITDDQFLFHTRLLKYLTDLNNWLKH